MNQERLEGILERIAGALEKAADCQLTISKHLSHRFGAGEESKRPSFEELHKTTEEGLEVLVKLNQDKGYDLMYTFGTDISKAVAKILAILPWLIGDVQEAAKYSRLIMSKEENDLISQFNQKIDEQVAPEFVKIRNVMKFQREIWDVYDRAREAAIVLFSEEGLWHRCQGGTTFRIRCLFDNDVQAIKASGSYEQLLMVKAAIKFISVLFENIKEPKDASVAA